MIARFREQKRLRGLNGLYLDFTYCSGCNCLIYGGGTDEETLIDVVHAVARRSDNKQIVTVGFVSETGPFGFPN